MQQLVNKVYEPLFKEHPRYFILMGGRGAGRSTVASQFALAKLLAPEYFRCAIMRYVLGDIRNSIYREITDRADETGIQNSLSINETTMAINYGPNSINAVGFRKSSSDQKSKLKSLANYNCVIVEEADEIPEADFMQLDDSLRTIKGDITIILLFNPPPKNHWLVQRFFDLVAVEAHTDFYTAHLKPTVQDTVFISSSYEDNIKNISDQTIRNYRNYETTKPDHFYNMIKGYIPEVVKGKIYNNWAIIDGIPFEARLERRGLDFGYTNDPTAMVDIYYWNGAYILDETCYQWGMSNRAIADTIKALPITLIMADSAEPKSIDEIKGFGYNIQPTTKGPGSVNQGIQFVKDQRIYVTRRSLNIIKEYENYAWLVDKEGTTLNEPKPSADHTMDAIRYALSSFQPSVPDNGEEFQLYVGDFK